MVNFNPILNYGNCPTLESWLCEDNITNKYYEEQKYAEFPPRDILFEREDNLNVYKENPVLKSLIELYQTFFEKGIDYNLNGKTWNVYPTGSMLWYYNEAFSLCTKLSIDPCPEQYFFDEYYKDINGKLIERYFVLSIFYALLAVNGLVRRQHLKMVDVLYNFLSIRCPFSIMAKCMIFIGKTYEDNQAIAYLFEPAIDCFGNTLLKVYEGLPEDKEEEWDLFTQMRKKVCENWLRYAQMYNIKPQSIPPKELLTDETQPYWTKLREKGFIVDGGYVLAEGVSLYDATFIADNFGVKLKIKNKWNVFERLWGLKHMAQYRNDYSNKSITVPHQNEINEIFGIKPKEKFI